MLARMKKFTVTAIWDEDADVWTVIKSDIPGLCAEADTLPELEAYLLELIPELLQLNSHLLPDVEDYKTVPIDLIANYRNRLEGMKVA